jgi:energy-coupling factor transporter ATP-binding protein EcfA2
VVLTDLPQYLLKEDKYGLAICGYNKEDNCIYDDICENHEKALRIRLEVKKDLEPKWYVVDGRNKEAINISASDRSKFSVYLISDSLDRHFSWNKGNPLYTLYNSSDEQGAEKTLLMDLLRETKGKIDEQTFSQFDEITKKIKDLAVDVGADIKNIKTTMDFRDLVVKDGRVCLHEDKIPLRATGKGTKRLLSIAIQMSLMDKNGIVLIDEVEQGLEPDRVQHLVSELKKNNEQQFFINTHSRNVIVELDAKDIFLIEKNKSRMQLFDSDIQGCLRRFPEVVFAKKIIVCEGKSEVGLLRAFNEYRIKIKRKNISHLGVILLDGNGHQSQEYASLLSKYHFEVCLFCDSDDTTFNSKKEALINSGIKIFDWDNNDCLEVAICKDLPSKNFHELLKRSIDILVLKTRKERKDVMTSMADSLKQRMGKSDLVIKDVIDTPEFRQAVGNYLHDKDCFKDIDRGEIMGQIVFECIENIIGSKVEEIFGNISNWIDA